MSASALANAHIITAKASIARGSALKRDSRVAKVRHAHDSIRSRPAREIRDTIHSHESRVRTTDERLDRRAIGREARRDRSRGLVRGFGRQHGTRDVERARDGRRDRIGRSERFFLSCPFDGWQRGMNGRGHVPVGVMRAVDVPKRAREVFSMWGTRARRVVVGSD